jgi:transcriptional regulator with XRE-family HTH domain
MAEILGVSVPSISNYEHGRNPRGGELALVRAWSKATGVDEAWLLGIAPR